MVKLKNGFTGERALVLPRMIVDKLEEDPLTSMLHITDIGYYPKAKHLIGRLAAQKLIDLIENPKATIIDKFTVDGTLFPGASVRNLAK